MADRSFKEARARESFTVWRGFPLAGANFLLFKSIPFKVPSMDIHTEELSALPITNRSYGDLQEEGNNLFPKLNIMGKYLSSKCFIKMHIFASKISTLRHFFKQMEPLPN